MSFRVALICIALTCAGSLHGEILNFKFSGIITDADPGSLDSSVTNGSPFTGFYTFDTGTADSDPLPDVGDYQYANPACGVVIQVGNYVFRSNPDHVDFLIETGDRINDDFYLFRSYANVASVGPGVDHISWQMSDPFGTAMTNDALPTVPPNLGAFSDNLLSIEGKNFTLSGPVQSISVIPANITNAPAASIGRALEVNWPSMMGYFYQVQESTNLATWSDRGGPILSTGDPISLFVRPETPNKYFRLINGPGSLGGGGLLNFRFDGTITDADVAGSPLDASITKGTPFTGFYTFDPATPDSESDPTVGDYEHTNTACGVAIKVGNYVFRTHPYQVNFLIEPIDRPGDDSYVFYTETIGASGGLQVDSLGWQLDDYSGTAWTNDSLPVIPPNLNAFPDGNYISIDGGNYFLMGPVEFIGVNPTTLTNPPPATIYPAVELSWPSVLGYFYRLQESTDLATWTDRGRSILGTGKPISFFARQQAGSTYFRLLIANHGN